jgi:hypothetical protein
MLHGPIDGSAPIELILRVRILPPGPDFGWDFGFLGPDFWQSI